MKTSQAFTRVAVGTVSVDPTISTFMKSLVALAEIAARVASLERRHIWRGIDRLGDRHGEMTANLLDLMDSIEADFESIRRKLGA